MLNIVFNDEISTSCKKYHDIVSTSCKKYHDIVLLKISIKHTNIEVNASPC